MADILAIDDEDTWRELYVEALAEAGHTVRTCKDGVEALEEICWRTPDLVVLDIKMRPSGALLLKAIRRFWSRVPVVLCTAHPIYRHDQGLSDADAFLVKSPSMGALIDTIDRVLLARGNRTAGDA